MEEGRRNCVFGKKEFLICQPFEYVCCSGQSVYVSENSIYYTGLQRTLRFRPRSIASWTECAKPCFESAIQWLQRFFLCWKVKFHLPEIRGQTKGHTGLRVKVVSGETSVAIHSLQKAMQMLFGPARRHDWNRETRANVPRNRDVNLAAASGCENGSVCRGIQIKDTQK